MLGDNAGAGMYTTTFLYPITVFLLWVNNKCLSVALSDMHYRDYEFNVTADVELYHLFQG